MNCRWLDGARFVQVHRAAIVNLYMVARSLRNRCGCSIVELNDGLEQVEASRSGAELLPML